MTPAAEMQRRLDEASGETVHVQAATQEEAEKLMAEARRLLEAKG